MPPARKVAKSWRPCGSWRRCAGAGPGRLASGPCASMAVKRRAVHAGGLGAPGGFEAPGVNRRMSRSGAPLLKVRREWRGRCIGLELHRRLSDGIVSPPKATVG
jgi:hypothetical protein